MEDKRIKMVSKYPGTCCVCNNNIRKGTLIIWCPDTKNAWHEGCKTKPAKGNKKKAKAKTKAKALVAQRPARGSVRHFTF